MNKLYDIAGSTLFSILTWSVPLKLIFLTFYRLRHLVRRLQKEDISKEDLQKNLEYAASVLETVYIDETR